MTRPECFQKVEDCLQQAENNGHDEQKARVYLEAANLWLRLAQAQ